MPPTSQLCQLIFDFYRENPTELIQLHPLMQCQISRVWGTLRINCPDPATLEAVQKIYPLWQEPLALLRVTKKIKLLVKGQLITTQALTDLPVTKNI